jgi:hypothetical protein
VCVVDVMKMNRQFQVTRISALDQCHCLSLSVACPTAEPNGATLPLGRNRFLLIVTFVCLKTEMNVQADCNGQRYLNGRPCCYKRCTHLSPYSVVYYRISKSIPLLCIRSQNAVKITSSLFLRRQEQQCRKDL